MDQDQLRAKAIRLRKTLHWTQLQFGRTVKLGRTKISDWENGYVDLNERECARVENCFADAFGQRRKQLDQAEAALLGAGA